MATAEVKGRRKHAPDSNKLQPEDQPVHEWYRFNLSFPPHLVRTYLEQFGIGRRDIVLDPFCGTGTTLVECKKRGIRSVGVEANSLASFACRTKTNWAVDPGGLMRHADKVAASALSQLVSDGIADKPLLQLISSCNGSGESTKRRRNLRSLNGEQQKLLLTNSISPLPLHKTLVLLESLDKQRNNRYDAHERLALATALVQSISNLHFGPEVGVGPPKDDASVVGAWRAQLARLASDLLQCRSKSDVPALVHHGDSRCIAEILKAKSVSAVITSPPYPNEKDYTRTTRLESVLLGFIRTKQELRALKKGLVRSNTRTVYKDDTDDSWVADHKEVQRISRTIESRRIAMGKTSGFERQYHRVAKLYFGGMARHLAELRTILRPGAQLAYVVGDQASYLRVLIRTGQLLGDIAESLGYELVRIDLFRTRLATATRAQLREEVVVLRWPG